MSKNHTRLAWAIIEQAVFDVQELTKMGLIRKGRAVRNWPCHERTRKRDGAVHHVRIPYVALGDYYSTGQVDELIWFFERGTMRRLLCSLHSEIDPAKICAKLGLKEDLDIEDSKVGN